MQVTAVLLRDSTHCCASVVERMEIEGGCSGTNHVVCFILIAFSFLRVIGTEFFQASEDYSIAHLTCAFKISEVNR